MTPALTIIRPKKRGTFGLVAEVSELLRYRFFLVGLIRRDMKIRYRGTALGVLWSMVNPLIQIFVMTVAIGTFMGAGPHNMSAYIMCGMLAWNFFQASIMEATGSMMTYHGLIKKVYFPREIPVVSAVCSNFIHMLISTGVFIFYRWGVLTLIFHRWPGWPPREVLWLPVLMLLTFMLTLGIAFIVAAANFFYEDVRFLTQMVMNFMLFCLPILYFAENILQAKKIPTPSLRLLIYHLYLLNPLAWLVTAFKQIFFGRQILPGVGAVPLYTGPFDYTYFGITAVVCTAVLLSGYYYFNRLKWKFAEKP